MYATNWHLFQGAMARVAMNSYSRQVSECESCRLTRSSMGACGFVSNGNLDPLLSETAHDFPGGLAPPFRSRQHGHPSGLMLRLISHFSPSLGYSGNSSNFHGFSWIFFEGAKNHHQIASSQRWLFKREPEDLYNIYQSVVSSSHWSIIFITLVHDRMDDRPRVLTILGGLTNIKVDEKWPKGLRNRWWVMSQPLVYKAIFHHLCQTQCPCALSTGGPHCRVAAACVGVMCARCEVVQTYDACIMYCHAICIYLFRFMNLGLCRCILFCTICIYLHVLIQLHLRTNIYDTGKPGF